MLQDTGRPSAGIQRRPVRLAFAGALVWLAVVPASAARQAGDTLEDEPTHGVRGLEGTVVLGTGEHRDPIDVPYSNVVIDEQRIRRHGYRTTPQILSESQGVLVQETSYGQGSPYLRGFTGFRNVFLIDGIRLNHSAFRDGPNQYWNTVDPFSIGRLEVVRGPASVRHGSDAIGGAVLATLRRPDAYGKGRPSAKAHYRFSSAERSHILHADASVAQGDSLGVRIGGTGKRFHDLRGGESTGTQEETGYDEWAADILAEYFLDDSWELVLAFQSVRQHDVPRTHRTVFAEPFRGTTVGSDLRRDLDQERQLAFLQLHGRELDGPLDSAGVSLSWQGHEEARHRTRGSGSMDVQGFEVNTLGLVTSAAAQTPVGRLSFGLDYYRDSVDSFSSGNPIQGPVADDANYELLGAFVEDEVPLGDDLDLLLGARLQWARLEADSVQDPATLLRISLADEWSQVLGSARFVYRWIEETLHLFGGVSQGFRAPNLSDVTRLDSARTNEFEIPSPGLEPESAISYELGIKGRGASGAGELAVFYTDLRDAITRIPTGVINGAGEAEVVKANAGDGYVAGIEVEGSRSLGAGFSVSGNGTYLNGKLDTFPTSAPVVAREPIDRLMPLTLRGSVTYEPAEAGFWSELGLVWADDADRLSTRDRNDTSRIPPGGTPGYFLVHLRGGLELADGAELSLALENVTNEDYRIHGSGQNSPGRSLVFGFTWTL